MDEFALIRQHFSTLTAAREGVTLGIGDDAALLQMPAGQELVVSTDTLVAGRHFPLDTAPADIGWKSLAVNLSDLAAMGAEPRWFTLALTLPEADEAWLSGFAGGLRELADRQRVALVGGDTTRGPLSITVSALGLVPAGAALRRDGARPGDLVCVTGSLGDAALALRKTGTGLDQRLNRPEPRVAAGLALRGLASAALDLSDGLAGDLGHILRASGVGAVLEASRLPMSPAFQAHAPSAERLTLQAQGGDDYELCVCVPPQHLAEAQGRLAPLPLTPVGHITGGEGLQVLDAAGGRIPLEARGYRHF